MLLTTAPGTRTARVSIDGHQINATPIEELPNGNWRMRSNQHGPRVVAGTEIEVRPDEILSMTVRRDPAVAAPATTTTDPAPVPALILAAPMSQVIASNDAVKWDTSQPSAPAPPAAPSPTAEATMTPNLNTLHDKFAAVLTKIEIGAGKVHQKLDGLLIEAMDGIQRYDVGVTNLAASVRNIHDAANQMNNGGPPLAGSTASTTEQPQSAAQSQT